MEVSSCQTAPREGFADVLELSEAGGEQKIHFGHIVDEVGEFLGENCQSSFNNGVLGICDGRLKKNR